MNIRNNNCIDLIDISDLCLKDMKLVLKVLVLSL